MRILRVKSCDDPDCPFFKRIKHYDYDDECYCLNKDEEIPQFKFVETDRGMENIESIAGDFPEWCPLEKI